MEQFNYTSGVTTPGSQNIFADVEGVGAVHLHRHEGGNWVVLYWGGENYPCFNINIGLCFAKDGIQTRPATIDELLADENFAHNEVVLTIKALIEKVYP